MFKAGALLQAVKSMVKSNSLAKAQTPQGYEIPASGFPPSIPAHGLPPPMSAADPGNWSEDTWGSDGGWPAADARQSAERDWQLDANSQADDSTMAAELSVPPEDSWDDCAEEIRALPAEIAQLAHTSS